MGKPRICGMARPSILNRDADKRRRNKAYFKGQNFVDGEYDRRERKLEKQLIRQKEAVIGKA